MSRVKAKVTYVKPSGEEIEVNFSNLRDAQEYAAWMEKADPNSKPVVHDVEGA